MKSDYKNLEVSVEDKVAKLCVNRPKKLNALNGETLDELEEALEGLGQEASVGAVVVTGAGEKAFVAGADISELARLSAAEAREASLRGQAVFRRLETLGKPVIAAVNGYALGGGLELALACHLRVASEQAKLGLPEVSLGAIPGYGGTQRLARLVGRGRALELILTGNPVDAQEAYRIGLVNRVVEGDVLAAASELARQVLRQAPLALAYALEAVDRGLDADLLTGLNLEASLFGNLAASKDWSEGMHAFLEKRAPSFKGK